VYGFFKKMRILIKLSNWDEIVEHCTKALVSCGLDFGACDSV
jgi:hypothetical protein